jgi:hypothetical protein
MVKDFLDALQVTWGEVQRHDYDVVILDQLQFVFLKALYYIC